MADSAGVRMLDMARKGDMTDITLVVQGTELTVHRAMVASRGGTLKDLLKENLLKKNPKKRISIGDEIAPQTFQSVLKYIYTDSLHLCDENLFDLVFAAKKLRLNDLEKRCAEFVKTKVTVENIGNFTEEALQFGSEPCTTTCLEYLKVNMYKLFNNGRFLEMTKDTLEKLCETEGLQCPEGELFSFCVKWAKKECQRNGTGTSPDDLRSALGDIIRKFKFSRMTVGDLMLRVVPTGILTAEALGNIMYSLEGGPNISVTVGGCGECFDLLTTYNLTRSATIAEVKKRLISARLDGNYFSLAYNGIELSNDTVLASLSTEEYLKLTIYSYRVTVKSDTDGPFSFNFPLMIHGDYCRKDEDIVKAYVQVTQGLKPQDLSVCVLKPNKDVVPNKIAWLLPGYTAIVKLKDYFE